jgi:hypothetical protein
MQRFPFGAGCPGVRQGKAGTGRGFRFYRHGNRGLSPVVLPGCPLWATAGTACVAAIWWARCALPTLRLAFWKCLPRGAPIAVPHSRRIATGTEEPPIASSFRILRVVPPLIAPIEMALDALVGRHSSVLIRSPIRHEPSHNQELLTKLRENGIAYSRPRISCCQNGV